MLRLCWDGMLEFAKWFFDKSWHASLKSACFVVPLETDANILATFPVDSDVVVALQRVFQVASVFVSDKLDAKIIYDKCECNWPSHMSPEPWRKLAGMVSVGAHALH